MLARYRGHIDLLEGIWEIAALAMMPSVPPIAGRSPGLVGDRMIIRPHTEVANLREARPTALCGRGDQHNKTGIRGHTRVPGNSFFVWQVANRWSW